MRPTIKMLFDSLGIKWFFVIPVAIFILIIQVEGGDATLPEVVNPANVGAFTLLLMFAFGTQKDLFTLMRLLPVRPGEVAAALQITFSLMLVFLNAPYLLLAFVLEKISSSGITLQYAVVFLLINLILMVTLFNLLLPLLLVKGLKPLKIIVVAGLLGMPFLIGEVSSLMAKKLGDSTFTAVVAFTVIAALVWLLGFRLSKAGLRAYEA